MHIRKRGLFSNPLSILLENIGARDKTRGSLSASEGQEIFPSLVFDVAAP